MAIGEGVMHSAKTFENRLLLEIVVIATLTGGLFFYYVDRSGKNIDFGVKSASLIKLDLPGEMMLCQKN